MSTTSYEILEHVPALAPTTYIMADARLAERPDRAPPPDAPRSEPGAPRDESSPPAEQHDADSGFWTAVRDALRGVEHDYTRGAIGRSILLLAVPMVLEMAMESVFAVTDVFFVGRLGADAVATVGLTESLLTVVYALAMGLAIGATAVVARRVGEKDPERAAESAVQAIALALVVSLALGISGVLLAPRLLALMGASPGVLAMGTTYARVMLGGEVSIITLFVVNAVFRGAGDAAIAMRVLWLANAINIVLGPCLVFGVGPFPRLGVTGAAIATTIGRSTGALFALWRLTRPNSRVSVARRHVRLDRAVIAQIVRVAGSGTLQSLIGTASWIGLVRIVAGFGSLALAGYTIGIRIVIFALLPSWGLSNAAATMVGQALGAKDPRRAESAVWRTGLYNLAFLGTVGVLFVVAAPWLVSLFTHDTTVAANAASCLRIVASGFVFYAYGMVLVAAFNGAGDTRTPTLLNLAIFWAFEIPLAWVLAKPLGMGTTGVFLSIAVAFSLMAVVAALLFRRGTWKTKMV
ncbi:MAG: MATE family efflux transporter [Gemmatirosa sp.]|nr:MATE family efflux transporter [Gemmatirosa sp.]